MIQKSHLDRSFLHSTSVSLSCLSNSPTWTCNLISTPFSPPRFMSVTNDHWCLEITSSCCLMNKAPALASRLDGSTIADSVSGVVVGLRGVTPATFRLGNWKMTLLDR